MELEPELELVKSRNRNHNLSKVGTEARTVKNSYGSLTLAWTEKNKTFEHIRFAGKSFENHKEEIAHAVSLILYQCCESG
jgi:hypothetical protein